jgi:hypothetical protein
MLSLYDFAAAKAGGADANVLGSGADFGVDRAQVDVPAPLGHVVGVTDGVAELRPLAADITNSCHDREFLLRADAER